MWRLENILLWNLMAAVILLGQARPNMKLNSQSSSGLRSDCVGNLMRLSLDRALAVGNELEVEAVGFFDDAKSDFQQALQLNPDFEDAKVSLQQTRLDQQHKIERGY